jgi:hypothetical protein
MTTTEYAEAPVVRKGLRTKWATTTSSLGEREIPEVSGSSADVSLSGADTLLAIVTYVRPFSVLPQHRGIALLWKAPAEQSGLAESILEFAHHSTASVWNALPTPNLKAYRRSLPSPVSSEDLLDWDVVIQPAPTRPSRKISMTVRYTGRSIPSPDLSDE